MGIGFRSQLVWNFSIRTSSLDGEYSWNIKLFTCYHVVLSLEWLGLSIGALNLRGLNARWLHWHTYLCIVASAIWLDVNKKEIKQIDFLGQKNVEYTIYSLYYIYFSQHNYIIKAQVKVTCFDLKSHRQAKLRTVKFFTMWLCASGISDGSQCEPSGIPNAHSHIVKNFTVLSLAWR